MTWPLGPGRSDTAGLLAAAGLDARPGAGQWWGEGGAGAGGARPQAAFKAAGRGMLSDVQTEIEAWQGKSSSVA
jgi:hypothetical protein